MTTKNKKYISIALLVVLGVIMLLLPTLANRRIINIAIITLMYIVLGTSWNLLSGMSGLFSIAHALFFGLGAYSTTIMTTRLGQHLFVGIIVGMLVNTLMASLVGFIGSKLSGLYFTMALIGLHQTVFSIAIQMSQFTGGYMGISMPKMYLLSKTTQYYIILAFAVLAILFFIFVRKSRIGTNFVALKENPNLAISLGSNIVGWRILATIFSACIASLAGSFYALFMMANTPDVFAGVISLKIIMVVIVGGMGYAWGPVLGSSLIILDELVRGLMPSKYAPFSVVIYASALIIITLLRPKGLMSFFTHEENKRRLVASESGQL